LQDSDQPPLPLTKRTHYHHHHAGLQLQQRQEIALIVINNKLPTQLRLADAVVFLNSFVFDEAMAIFDGFAWWCKQNTEAEQQPNRNKSVWAAIRAFRAECHTVRERARMTRALIDVKYWKDLLPLAQRLSANEICKDDDPSEAVMQLVFLVKFAVSNSSVFEEICSDIMRSGVFGLACAALSSPVALSRPYRFTFQGMFVVQMSQHPTCEQILIESGKLLRWLQLLIHSKPLVRDLAASFLGGLIYVGKEQLCQYLIEKKLLSKLAKYLSMGAVEVPAENMTVHDPWAYETLIKLIVVKRGELQVPRRFCKFYSTILQSFNTKPSKNSVTSSDRETFCRLNPTITW